MEVAIVYGLFLIYFAPTSIAVLRRDEEKFVFWVNLLLGWTIMGWILALLWAVGNNKD